MDGCWSHRIWPREKPPWLCSSYWWLTSYSDGGGVVMSSSSDIAASITSWLRDNPVRNPSAGVGGSGRSASSLKYGIGTVVRLNKCRWLPWELRKADTFSQNMQVLVRGRRIYKMGGRRRRGCHLAIPEPVLPLVTGAGEALILEHAPPRYSVVEVWPPWFVASCPCHSVKNKCNTASICKMPPQAPYMHTLGNEGRGGAADSINLQNVCHSMLCQVEHKSNGSGFGKVVHYNPLYV